MTLRLKFLLYLVTLHLVFAACAVWFLRDQRIWLIAVEAFFFLSLVVGVYLVRAYFGPLKLIESGAQYLRNGEFTTRFAPTGQADMDRLVDVYNRMVDRLREERDRLRREREQKQGGLNKALDENERLRGEIADVDNGLGNGADEDVWPPGKTRGEAIAAIRAEVEGLAGVNNRYTKVLANIHAMTGEPWQSIEGVERQVREMMERLRGRIGRALVECGKTAHPVAVRVADILAARADEEAP